MGGEVEKIIRLVDEKVFMSQDSVDEHIAERDIQLVEDNDHTIIEIETLHKQKMSPQNFMETFNGFTNQYRQNVNQHSNLQDRIEQVIENGGQALKALHHLDQDQEQRGEVKPNTVTTEDIKQYGQLQQMQQQKETTVENMNDIQETIEHMYPMAKKLHIRDDFDVRLPKNATLLEFLDIDDELRQDIMNLETSEEDEEKGEE